jgi:iron complex outermembrane receptor protein
LIVLIERVNMTKTLICKSVMCALLLAANNSIAAQESDKQTTDAAQNKSSGLEVIMVTSERRSETVQETPMSVTAFTGDMISEAGITSIQDVALQTPNLVIQTFNISEPQLFMRGVGTTNDSAASDPAVAVFIDDVYIGRPSGAAMDLYDLERIEVLRGPQGTLYGRNSAGGALNFFTKKPQQDFEAKAGLTLGNYGLWNIRGYVNGALTDTISGKLTANIRQRGGYAQNVTTGQELEDEDTKSIRGQLLIEPSDAVNILLGFDYTDVSGNGSNRFLSNFDIEPIFPVQAFVDAQLASNATFGNDPRKTNSDLIQSTSKELLGFQARVEVDLNWSTFTSISAYRESESNWNQPLVPTLYQGKGGTGVFEVNNGADQSADQISQEFRLSAETDSLQWVTGLFYFKENVKRDERFDTIFAPGILPAVLTVGDVNFMQDATTESVALFGQVTWDFSDDWALTAGARYTDDKKSINNIAVNNLGTAIGGIPLQGVGYDVDASDSWDAVTTRATLDWKVTDDHMLYVTFSEGFKSGSFTGQQSSPTLAATPIKPETSTNIEIGARTQWFDDRLRLNATYFQLDYDDLQTFFLTNNLLIADNANAEISGLEADFALAISDSLTVRGSYSSLDGEFVGGQNAGNETPRSPGNSWSLSPNYGMEMSGNAYLDFSLTISNTGQFFMDISNDLRTQQEAFTVVDASIKYTSASQLWDLTLWGKNIQDELYLTHNITGNFGGSTDLYAPPRTIGLTFNHYFW